MVRGVVTLPHGTGKEIKVLVLCAAESTDLAHDCGLSDDHVNIGPSALDLLDIFIETDIVGTRSLGSSFGVGEE